MAIELLTITAPPQKNARLALLEARAEIERMRMVAGWIDQIDLREVSSHLEKAIDKMASIEDRRISEILEAS